jgi:glycine/D-amino acid oxidase-like deaminating enzyme
LEKVLLKDKVIVHNYGHGGAGVSLAPGSAIAAVDLADSILKQNTQSEVAVLGSGIVGLFSCYELLKRYPQLKITVYAERIPEFGEKDNSKLITSQVAPGFWLPYHYGSNDELLHAKLSTLSLR